MHVWFATKTQRIPWCPWFISDYFLLDSCAWTLTSKRTEHRLEMTWNYCVNWSPFISLKTSSNSQSRRCSAALTAALKKILHDKGSQRINEAGHHQWSKHIAHQTREINYLGKTFGQQIVWIIVYTSADCTDKPIELFISWTHEYLVSAHKSFRCSYIGFDVIVFSSVDLLLTRGVYFIVFLLLVINYSHLSISKLKGTKTLHLTFSFIMNLIINLTHNHIGIGDMGAYFSL